MLILLLHSLDRTRRATATQDDGRRAQLRLLPILVYEPGSGGFPHAFLASTFSNQFRNCL
jgi:hypothetical protein